MGQQFFLQLSSEPADRHARPDWFGRMPDRTNRILVTAAGVTHRSQLAYSLRDGGCIDRVQLASVLSRSSGRHRLQFRAAKSVVKLMSLGNAWRRPTGCFRDQGRTVRVQMLPDAN